MAAQYQVHYPERRRHHNPFRRMVHRLDRVMLGAVMGAAAFVVERVVLRSTRRANAKQPEAS